MDVVSSPKLGSRIGAADRIGRGEAAATETRRLLLNLGVVAAVLLLAVGITFYIWHDVGALAPAASAEVADIERLLGELSFAPGAIDGVIDAETEAAIRAYQQAAGLPEDGRASPELLEELRAITSSE